MVALTPIGNAYVMATGSNVSDVDVSPGRYSRELGDEFPTFGSVKLSYPNSSILTNSIGDLLFAVRLNPLMINATSAQVWSPVFPNAEVQVHGSGFSSSDTTCTLTLSGIRVAFSCAITGGILTGSFAVPNVLAGAYTLTATGDQKEDFSSAAFTVLPPSLVLNPSSGKAGVKVDVSGFGFYSTDTGICHLTGDPVSAESCSILGGILTGSFTVVVSTSPGTYTIGATTLGADSGEAAASFTITNPPLTQHIELSASSGHVGATVHLSPPLPPPGLGSGSGGFLLADTTCFLSGNIIAAGSSTCSIAGGIPTASFTVGSVAPNVYSVTVKGNSTGNPTGDSATAEFQVLPSPELPNSTLVSLVVDVPSDFTGLTTSKVWTSFTNDYDPNSVSVSGSEISVNNLIVTIPTTDHTDPTDVAKRIFKADETQYIRIFQITSPTIAGRYFFKAFINGLSIGANNFPTLVVKASRDPAYISGVLRDSGKWNSTNAGRPIGCSPPYCLLPIGDGARIVATGIDYLGNPVSAQAFINSTADGAYTLFGVAPGTYNITAYAAGYVPTTLRRTISVAAAQSLEGVDIYLPESVKITGTVLSESCDGGLIPWGTVGIGRPRSISIQLLYLDGTTAAQIPAQGSFNQTADPNANTYSFTIQREVGLDNRIPQDAAGYTSGLSSNDYLLQAYVSSYVQLYEVRVHVGNDTAETSSTIPLIRSGTFFVTVHFRSSNSTIGEDQLLSPGALSVSAYDQQGVLRAQNTTTVPAGAGEGIVELQGFSNVGALGSASSFSKNYGIPPGTYYIMARFTSSPIYTGYANIGIRDLYLQTEELQATIGLCQIVSISLSMYKAAGIRLSLYAMSYQTPTFSVPWRFPGSRFNIMIIDSTGNIYQASPGRNVTQGNNQVQLQALENLGYIGLPAGSYYVIVQTLGYTQMQILHFSVQLGQVADGSIWMIEGPVIDLTVAFKDEGLLTFIDSTLPFAQPINHLDATPARIEVFDDQGLFVAANASYIPNDDTTAHFTLAGFNQYYGDPRTVWSGFYDTTDGAGQNPGGLVLYPWSNEPRLYTVRIWVEGYYQLKQLYVTVPGNQNASVVVSMDRASRVYGTVLGPDIYDEARPLSWATIDLEPNNRTLSDIIGINPRNYTTSSVDGFFQLWVPQGSYGMGVSLPGYSTYSAQISVPSGSNLSMQIWLSDYSMQQTAAVFETALAVAIAVSSQVLVDFLRGS
jgi:hypothetical protein